MVLGMRPGSAQSRSHGSRADQLGGGLVTRPGQQADIAEDLLPSETADNAGVVLELGMDELGHHIVGRILSPPVEILAVVSLGRGVFHRLDRARYGHLA